MLSLLIERRGWAPAGTARNPSAELLEAFGAMKSVAGPRVSSESALQYPPVWRAVNLISSYVAKLPCHVYRRVGEGKERDRKHPAYWLVRRKASSAIPVYFFRYALTAQALLRGNAYAFIFRDRSRRPQELIPLDPDTTYPDRERDPLVYRTALPGGEEMVLEAGDVLHLRALSDGIVGTSVIQKARDSIGTGLAQQEYEGRFYSNGARPSTVIEHPRRIGPEAVDTLRRSWMETYGGLRNAHKPGILEEGAQLKIFGMTHRDAEFVESSKVKIRDVANWFGLPAHKLGDDTRTSYNSLEQENQAFLDDCLDNWLSAWEAEYWDKLLTEREKREDTEEIEFLRQALVRADLDKRGEFYNLAINGGWMSRDEVRARENMNPIPGGEGKKYLEPLNMVPAGERDSTPAASDPEPDPEAEERAAARRRIEIEILSATLGRMARRLATTAEKAARHPESWLTFVESVGEDTVFSSAIGPICRLCGIELRELASRFFEAARLELDQCADVPPQQLMSEVTKAARRIESDLPARTIASFGD